MSLAYSRGGGAFGVLTQTAGTAIVRYANAVNGLYTYVVGLSYTNSTTAHVGTLMVGASRTTLTANAAASQAVVSVAAALTDGGGNAIASGDYVAVQLSNGFWHISTFSSASTLDYTLATNLPAAANSGATVVCFGVIGDAYHDNSDFNLAASATTTLPASSVTIPLARSARPGEPIIFYDGNATAAGTLNYLSWEYSKV